MSRFTSLLKRIDDRLKFPQPTKSRILLEIAADLEDLHLLYLERGLGEEEAAQLAEEKFDFSDKALQEFTHVHQTLFDITNSVVSAIQAIWIP